jgi:hypothetical protein
MEYETFLDHVPIDGGTLAERRRRQPFHLNR